MPEQLHNENKLLKSLDDRIVNIIKSHIVAHKTSSAEIAGVLEAIKIRLFIDGL